MFTIDQAKDTIGKAVSDYLQRFPAFIQANLGKYIKNAGSTGGEKSVATVFNTGNKLYSVSGKLFQSFIKGNVNNIYKVTQNGSSYNLEYGTKVVYAKIHEYGGQIKATDKSKRFARAMIVKTNRSPMWIRIYAAMRKKGYITMPKRPYFKPAVEDFYNNDYPAFQAEMRKSVIDAMAKLQQSSRS